MSAPAAYVPHYRMLLAGLGLDEIEPARERTEVDTAFLDFLIDEMARLLPFDPEFYAATYPDVAAAHRRGEVADLQQHFVRYGYREGRLPHAEPFDTDYYLQRNSDLAEILSLGGRAALNKHYAVEGRQEGRTGHVTTAEDASRWWRAARRTPYRLAHRSIAGASVRAFLPPLLAAPPLGFRGGLVLGDGADDRRLRHRRAGQAIDSFPSSDQPVAPLAGEYVYGGAYFNHFGHTMAEMIHRVLPARSVFDCRQLLFVGTGIDNRVAGFSALPSVMQAPLHFLGVDPDDVTVVHDHRLVELLHVAQQGSDLSGGPSAPYLCMLAEFTPARLEALHDGVAAARLLYVSRSRIPHGGTLLGERYLERLLETEGWHIYHPQERSLLDQMQAYYRAEAIIFAEGSAVHGVELFGADGLGHCVLLPRRADHRWIFNNVLRPRARRFDTLPSATLLGSVLINPRTGDPLDNLGVSLLDLSSVARALRELGLATLPGLDLPSYREAARADLAAYIAFHQARDLEGPLEAKLIDRPALAVFEARCAAALA